MKFLLLLLRSPCRLLLLLGLALPLAAPAHPMPSSAVLLTLHGHRIDAEVQIPLNEL